MRLLLAFDFDGVIADSIEPLKKVYYEFLSNFGFKGSDEEFQLLNGPSIEEVVKILKKNYNINKSILELLKNYKFCLSKAYEDAPLIQNVFTTLKYLNDHNVDLVLVTSSVRIEVERYLKKHKIKHFFKSIITGDEVKSSKPHPDIYLSIKDLYPNHTIWAIEDSYNGILAANNASIKVIYFDRSSLGTSLNVNCRISSLCDLKIFVKAFKKNYCVIEKSKKIFVNIVDDFSPKLNNQQDMKIEKLWNSTVKSSQIHDREMLFYLSHSSVKTEIYIKAFWAPYRYHYARIKDPSLKIKLKTLAVSGICKNENDSILIAKRTNVFEYNNKIELVPSGGIQCSSQKGKFIDYKDQLIRELSEETSLEFNSVSLINEVGLIEDLNNGVIDVCCSLKIKGDGKLDSEVSNEYRKFSWIHSDDLLHRDLLPTSIGLVSLCESKIEFNS